MDLKRALEELCEEVKRIVNERIIKYGVNERAKGKNTLVGSELQKSIKVKAAGENALVFQIADYYEYIVRGWKRTRSHPGTLDLFLKNIDDWVTNKNIRIGKMTQAQIVHYLYKKMILDGREIAPRPFINYDEDGYLTNMIPGLNDYLNKWFDELFEGIIEDLNKIFK